MALYDLGGPIVTQFPHLQTIRALDAEMPVLLLADDGANSIAADALYHGAWSGIVKTAEHLRLLPDIIVAALEKRRDIAQLQAQVGSLANSQRPDATLESMSSAFLAFDCNWNYTYVNAHAGKLFARAPEDLVGKHIWTEFPEGVGQPFHRVCERVMQTGEQEEFVDYYPTADRWFLKRVIPTGAGLSIFFDDITAQKQAELQLAASERHLRAIIRHRTGVRGAAGCRWIAVGHESGRVTHVRGRVAGASPKSLRVFAGRRATLPRFPRVD